MSSSSEDKTASVVSGDLQSATILTALDIAEISYDEYIPTDKRSPGETLDNLQWEFNHHPVFDTDGLPIPDPLDFALIANGWKPIEGTSALGKAQNVAEDSYQGVAF